MGDTIARMAAFTSYAANIKRNANGELFALFGKFGSRSFVKRLNGNIWELFGDSSTFGMPSGFHVMDFASPGTLVMGVAGNVDKKGWTCSGGGYQLLDLISHTGNFTQLTDLEISPVDGKPHVAFNCLPTHSFMRYELGLTSTNAVQQDETKVQIFPNPSVDGLFFVDQFEGKNETNSYSVSTTEGKEIMSGKLVRDEKTIDLQSQVKGLYFLRIQSKNRVQVVRLMKE